MRFLITAGPTREAIDPVRYLTNRSSGKMGYALAEAVVAQGHEATLISGPVTLQDIPQASMIRVESAQQMWETTKNTLLSKKYDIAILAAAVADYRPVKAAEQKIKKNASSLTLELERTPDILGSMRGIFDFRGFLVGFAAETENLVAHAMDKLKRKGCDLLVANDVSRTDTGFDSAENEVILCFPSGRIEPLPQQSKSTLAHEIVRRVVELAQAK